MRISDGVQTCALPISHGALLQRWFATYARLDDAGVTRFPLRAREPRDRWRIRWVFPMQGHAMLEERQTTIESARSEEHTSELQSLMRISYAVFCLKKKTNIKRTKTTYI